MDPSGPDGAIRRLLDAYGRGETTVRDELARALARIAAVDRAGPALNAVLRIDPDAQWTARRLDAERRSGAAMGPMHGVPVLLKDNIDTGGGSMATSAGALALADSFAPADAPLVRRLRAAGALIIGKTNMTELANYLSTGMPGGYSSLGGQVINPHHPALPVSTSSSGSAAAVAAGLCRAAIGTETAGSILVPAFANGIVGIKPTVGLVSRTGIVPISFSQDTAGPLARSVEDAARVLTVIAGPDEEDAATHGAPVVDYRRHLRRDGLRGARIGIPRTGFWDDQGDAWRDTLAGVRAALQDGGAQVVDPADLATADRIAWSPVMLYEFKAAMNAYLRRLGPGAPCRTLADLIAFNAAHAQAALRYGQVWLLRAEHETSGRMHEAAYLNARAEDLRLCRTEGIDATLDRYGLDALVFPHGAGSSIAARAGYPSVAVPLGFVPAAGGGPAPTGPRAPIEPRGVMFTGTAFSEPVLVRIAHAFELRTRGRVSPAL